MLKYIRGDNDERTFKHSCIKGSTPSIPYDEFENIVIAFIKEIMKLYLENTEFCNDMCSCVIRDLPNNTLGEFDIKNHINHIIVENVITIDKGVVKAIYFGKINFMSVIFHELNHFKNTYDMKLGRTNKDVIRVIKETLLTIATQDNIAKKNATKDSDIDLIIDTKSKLKGFALLKLICQIEEKLQKEIDGFEKYEIVENSLIDKEIRKTGVIVYEK